jgi:NADH-quinone oxidoreductase subunit G
MIVALYHIFGSEELSVLSPGISERVPAPYVALNPEDADLARVRDGHDARLFVGESVQVLQVKVTAGIPKGVAGLAVGIPGIQYVSWPAWGTVARE